MNKINVYPIKLFILIVSLASLCMFFGAYYNANLLLENNGSIIIRILGLLGIIEVIFIFVTWKVITNRVLSLYTMFMLFFFLFNFGQSLMWAFNIHIEGEIGTQNLYYYMNTPTDIEIVKSQLIVLISGLMIHLGATSPKKVYTNKNVINKNIQKNPNKDVILKTLIFITPLVIIAQFYDLVINFNNAKAYGYTALYYNPNVSSANVIVQILSRLFFPVLIGWLIITSYNKKVRYVVYSIFTLKILLSLFIGDRGGWIYALCLFIISHHYFYKRIRIKQALSFLVLGVAISYISVAVVLTRNTGVSVERIMSILQDIETNPIIISVFSMGSTMGITTVLVMNGFDIFPYGNSFFYGFLTAPSKDIIGILDLNYEPLGAWFSQQYLGISNGAGFSIVAESLINFGLILTPIFMILFGYILWIVTDIEYENLNQNPLKIILCIITTSVLINISRNVFSYNIGEVFYTVGQFLFYLFVFKLLLSKSKIDQKLKRTEG
ncbi:O-antigen polymerase [Exiguobacterium alkaliphilum]|uniref:O-antigen polymerase n=1 Tax=Exiguobacterium alkaliphilum TaxID=1428684 RepID=UPI00403A9DB8